MSNISLRLPDSLHDSARELAKRENISMNQLVTVALAEKMSALMTEDYLEKRARRGDRKKFAKAMAKVADVEPEQRDRI
ncbi:MAG: toxin-antitoxin system HicB family antitoxin [Pirellulales bacterium]|nr:toxin-antitoxin system HicB family antitoxin [Pirellulales bacterium]